MRSTLTLARTLGLALLVGCAGTGAGTRGGEGAPHGADAPRSAAEAAGVSVAFQDMDGAEHRVGAGSDAGTVALVFWQTWCASCKRESPQIAAAAEEHEEIAFYGVVPGADADVDDGEVRQVAAAWGLPYAQVRDRDLTLTELFGVTGTPDIVVLDGDGHVVYRGHRPPEDWGALH